MDNKNYMRNSGFFDRSGRRRPGIIAQSIPQKIQKEDPSKEDRENRQNILQEIETRCGQGEELDIVVAEIAGRKEIKQQFDYYEKNGIVNLAEIFKNWYQSYIKNYGNDKFYPEGLR